MPSVFGGLICAVLGALRTGVVPVLLNATLLEGERQALLADADPQLIITDGAHLAALDAGSPVELAPHPLTRPMHYTSGTTGRSKGVWAGLWDADTAAAAFADESDLWSFGPDDVHLVCSPMYHSVSIRFAGGTLLGRRDLRHPESVRRRDGSAPPCSATLRPGSHHGVHGPVGVEPPSRRGNRRQRFDSLRLLAHAGSPCPPIVKRQALERVGPDVLWEFYGSTEGQFTVCSPDEWLARPGTVGRARAGRTLSVDPDGTVWCRPPGFARFTYWRDPAKTAAAWRDGFFTVGDLGRMDADGYLYLDGRRDDLIISGGVNVYPAEVESVLSEVDGVAEIAVFGRHRRSVGPAGLCRGGTGGHSPLRSRPRR